MNAPERLPELSVDQTAVVETGLLRSSLVLQLPTGGGKTFLSLNAVREVLCAGRKAVYLAPLRALARELAADWRAQLPGIRVGVYTGEMGVDVMEDNPSAADAQVLVMTSEKFDLYLRTWSDNIGWLSEVDLVVADELHTMGSGRRGATLEGLITRLRFINRYARVLGLSATLGNPKELADWLEGGCYVGTHRPVPLKWSIRTHGNAESKLNIVLEEVAQTVRDGGQVIVFVQSRPRAETLAAKLVEAGFGAAAHHAGLAKKAREKSEGLFRARQLQVLCATPTLACGVNLPARKTVIFDLSRYEGSGFTDLSCNDVWQLAGRAGRRGLDAHGEVVLVSPKWNQTAARRYLKGQFEPIKSVMATSEAAFTEQLLAVFGSRVATTVDQACRVVSASLFGHQASREIVERRVRQSVDAMEAAGMLAFSESGFVRATKLGRIAVRFQLTPATVLSWAKVQSLLPGATFFDLLVLVCSSPDFNARVRADHSEAALLTTHMRGEAMKLGEISPQDRSRLLGAAGRDLGCAVKTALALRAWTRLGDDAEAAAAVGVHEHEVEEARMEAVRLLQAMSALTAARDKAEQEAEGEWVDLSEKIGALSAMVCAGLDDEAATLALIDGVGPVMARRLLGHGVQDIEALALADAGELAAMPGLSMKRAGAWIAEAEKFVGAGGALRYRELCGEQASGGEGPAVLSGLDYFRWERASKLKVTPNPPGWIVTGGSAPHQVSQPSPGVYVCDCGDAARGRMCKHVISIRHLLGDAAVPRFDEGFPEPDNQVLDLVAEWGRGRKALE